MLGWAWAHLPWTCTRLDSRRPCSDLRCCFAGALVLCRLPEAEPQGRVKAQQGQTRGASIRADARASPAKPTNSQQQPKRNDGSGEQAQKAPATQAPVKGSTSTGDTPQGHASSAGPQPANPSTDSDSQQSLPEPFSQQATSAQAVSTVDADSAGHALQGASSGSLGGASSSELPTTSNGPHAVLRPQNSGSNGGVPRPIASTEQPKRSSHDGQTSEADMRRAYEDMKVCASAFVCAMNSCAIYLACVLRCVHMHSLSWTAAAASDYVSLHG